MRVVLASQICHYACTHARIHTVTYAHCTRPVWPAARLISPAPSSGHRAEKSASLHDLVNRWLERTPFLQSGSFSFWSHYRKAVDNMLEVDRTTIECGTEVIPSPRVQVALTPSAACRWFCFQKEPQLGRGSQENALGGPGKDARAL